MLYTANRGETDGTGREAQPLVHLSPQALDIPRVLVNEPVFKIVNCGSNAEIGPDTIRLAPAGQSFVGFGFDEDDVVA